MKNNVFNILSITLGIAAICIALLRCEPMTTDWMGVLVGVLSLLVTFLLGWQIYTIFNIKEIQKEVKSKEREIYLRSETNQAETHMALWAFYQTIMTEGDLTGNSHYGFVQSGIAAIIHFSKCNNHAKASSIAMTLVRYLPKLQIREHSDKFFDTSLKALLSGVENPNRIPEFGELLSALYKARG